MASTSATLSSRWLHIPYIYIYTYIYIYIIVYVFISTSLSIHAGSISDTVRCRQELALRVGMDTGSKILISYILLQDPRRPNTTQDAQRAAAPVAAHERTCRWQACWSRATASPWTRLRGSSPRVRVSTPPRARLHGGMFWVGITFIRSKTFQDGPRGARRRCTMGG